MSKGSHRRKEDYQLIMQRNWDDINWNNNSSSSSSSSIAQ